MSIKVKPKKGATNINVVSRRLDEEVVLIREAFAVWPTPWVPRVDIYEKGEELVVEIELPGVDHRDLAITVHANRIDLQGRKREEEAVKGGRYIRLEREYGEFSRFIPLPCLVFPDHSRAFLEDGILVIRLKKYRHK